MDYSEFGLATGGYYDSGGTAVSDECAHEDSITPVCDRDAVSWTFGDDFGVFDDGVVFSC